MALVVANRVQETSNSSGTGALSLAGAVLGYQTFASGIGNGNTTFYTLYDSVANVWEAGIGTLTVGTPSLLARTTVLSNSSGTTSPLTLAGNTINVWCDYPAEKAVYKDASGNVTLGGNLTVSGTTVLGSLAGVLKGTSGTVSAATAGTDYVAPGGALGTPSSGTLTNCTGLPVSTGVSGLGTGVATFLATPTSANLAAALTDETGTGANVFANTPTLVTPILGTPTSGTLTSCTGLPISTGVSGLGTGVATALAVNVGTAGAPVVNGGVLGTPSSGTLTNCTGLPIATGVSGLGSNVATFLATPTSANLAAALTDETGTGASVFANTPTLVSPILGTPTSGTLSNCTVDGTNSVGYLNIPQNAQTGNYTLVAADAGKHIYHASGAGAATYTIPANGSVGYAIGTALTFVNMSATSISIAITTDTMYLAGAGTTGTRTLAQYGSATALKLTSTTWVISGAGLS